MTATRPVTNAARAVLSRLDNATITVLAIAAGLIGTVTAFAGGTLIVLIAMTFVGVLAAPIGLTATVIAIYAVWGFRRAR